MLLVDGLVPGTHGLQTVLLLHQRVNGVETETVVDDVVGMHGIHGKLTASGENDSGKLSAVTLEFLGLLDRVWEVNKNELGARLDARVDVLLEHLDNEVVQVSLVVFAGADLLVNLFADLGVTLSLFLDEFEDLELLEALGLLQLSDDFTLGSVSVLVAARSHKENRWLNVAA